MRLKWYGILVLLIALALTIPRGVVGANMLWDSAIVLVVSIGVTLVAIDCRVNDKKHIESIQKQAEGR